MWQGKSVFRLPIHTGWFTFSGCLNTHRQPENHKKHVGSAPHHPINLFRLPIVSAAAKATP
ncbi:hypothetical protein [Kingella oralis]